MEYTRMDEMYVMTRKTDGKLWYDYETISHRYEEAKRKANLIDTKIPQWAKANPQMKTIKILISESNINHPINS